MKKIGKISDGGGGRFVGHRQGRKNRAATPGKPRNKYRGALIGTCYLHTVTDGHSRVAYVEAHDDETKETATEVLKNAVAWFAERGVTVQRVLSDNGSCYKSHLWRDSCTDLGITPKKTRPGWASQLGEQAVMRAAEHLLECGHKAFDAMRHLYGFWASENGRGELIADPHRTSARCVNLEGRCSGCLAN